MKKQYRILKNQEFQRILAKKKRYFNQDLTINIDYKQEKYARVGLSVSKKVGNAVTRNKVRRQLRMMLDALIDYENFDYDLIIIVRKTYLNNSFEINKNNLENLLKKYIKCKI